MANWPDKSFIRIIKGYDSGKLREDIIAFKCKGGNSYRGDNCHIVRGYPRDSIDEWEEVTAVPTAALKRLQDAFRGVDVIRSLEPPLLEVLSHLPADKPNALDRAAAMVEDMGGPMISAENPSAERLSLLMDALASVQDATRKTIPLAMVARICADWLDIIIPSRIGLNDIVVSAQEIENITADDERRYLSLTYCFAQAATLIGEGGSGSSDIKDLGAYALAWATQIIEEEDK